MTRKKPEAQKRASGTYRGDRARTPVDAPAIEPMMPKHLPDDAKAVWRAQAPALVKAGLLSSVDGPTFGLLCRLIAHLDECYKKGEIPSRDVMAHFRPLAKSFGMDPDARHKLAIEPEKPEAPDNPFAKLRPG